MSRKGWRVVVTRQAERDLRRVPADVAARLAGPIAALGLDPRPAGCEKVVDTDAWRIRVGNTRVIYQIDRTSRAIVIVRVAQRSESTYRRLR